MAKGKITYKQFVTQYKRSEDTAEFCKSHIITSYVDYQTKLTEIRKIADLGNYSSIPALAESGEMRIFRRNTPIMYYLLKMRLLIDYTDIDIKDGEELEVFNALDEIGAVDNLISSIPENEVVKWNTMLQMVNDDIYMNDRDLTSFLETKVEALSVVMNTMLSGLEEVADRLGTANENN